MTCIQYNVKCKISDSYRCVVLESMKRFMPNQTTSKLRYKDLIVFLVGLLSKESGFLQLVLQCVHTLFIRQRPVFQDLAGATHKIQVQYNVYILKSRVAQVKKTCMKQRKEHLKRQTIYTTRIRLEI